MMKTNHRAIISAKQLAFLIIASRIAGMTAFMPLMTRAASVPRDAWIAALLSGMGGIAITWLVIILSSRHPDQSMVQISVSLLGKWFGGLVSVIFLFFYLFISITFIRDFAEILHTALMPETPLNIFIFFIGIAVVCYVYRGLEAIARANSITLPVAAGSLLLIIGLSFKEFSHDMLLPVLEDGWRPVIQRSVIPFTWFGEVVIIPMLFPYVRDKANVLRYGLFAQLVSMVLLTILALTVVGVFGAEEAQNLTLPIFSLARMVSIARFFERIEAVMVMIWISMLLTKMSIYLYAGVIGVGQLFGLKSYKKLIIPLAFVAVILSITSYDRLADYIYTYTINRWGIFALTIETIPLILLVISVFRKKKVRI